MQQWSLTKDKYCGNANDTNNKERNTNMNNTGEFNFVHFENVGSKLSNYFITITKNGAFGLSSGFYHTENIKEFSHAMIFHDSVKKVIGLVFTNTPTKKGAFKITHTKKFGSASIIARSFFSFIFPKNSAEKLKEINGRYTPKTYSDTNIGSIYYIDLNKKE